MPPSQTSSGSWTGRMPSETPSTREMAAGERHLLASPQGAHHGQRFLQKGGPLPRRHPLGRQFLLTSEPDDGQEQESTIGEPVEAGQLAGQEHGVAARQDEMGAKLQPRPATGGRSKGGDGIQGRGGDDVGDPQGVVAELLEGVDELEEGVGLPRHPRSGGHPDPDLHRVTRLDSFVVSTSPLARALPSGGQVPVAAAPRIRSFSPAADRGGKMSPMQGSAGPADVAVEGIDRNNVTRWLAERVEIEAPLRFELIAGGRSNMTFTVIDAAEHASCSDALPWASCCPAPTTWPGSTG